MKIFLYSRAFPPGVGGVERFAETLAGSLSDRGHAVCVGTRSESEEPEPDRNYRVVRGASPDRVARLARSADVVHANGLSLRGVAIGLAARRPTVVTHAKGTSQICPTGLCLPRFGRCDAAGGGLCAGCPEAGIKGIMDVRSHRRAARGVRANVAVSHYLRRRIALPRSTAVHSPVRSDAFDAAVDAAGVGGSICFAGRLVEEKGVALLLHALVRVPDASLEIVGDGPIALVVGGLGRSSRHILARVVPGRPSLRRARRALRERFRRLRAHDLRRSLRFRSRRSDGDATAGGRHAIWRPSRAVRSWQRLRRSRQRCGRPRRRPRRRTRP